MVLFESSKAISRNEPGSYYVCGTLLKKGSGSCKSHYINSRRFERLVIDKIKEYILTEENLRELVRLVNEEMDASFTGHRDQLDATLKEIAEVNRRLDRLYDAIETGKVTLDDLSARIKQLKEQKEKLESQKWELEWQMKAISFRGLFGGAEGSRTPDLLTARLRSAM
ncbi:MAG: hypothetical protein NTZ34_03940 [Chloroflexi bacterium]|nr:hypothetical protein [Chloroflexota bacterium]